MHIFIAFTGKNKMARTYKEKLLESGVGNFAAELLNEPGLHGSNIVTAETNPLTGGIESLTAGGQVISPYASFTWAGKPAVAAWPVGVPIIVTDVGGPAGSQWVTDGSNWLPANGRVVLASRSGSIAAPVATLTGTTTGKFTLPANIVLPAGILMPGKSKVEVIAALRKTGTAATVQFAATLGTANSTVDAALIATTSGAGTNSDVIINPLAAPSSTSSITTSSWSSIGTTGTANFIDRTTNINTALDMFVNLAVFSGNVADTYSLLSYEVAIKS